MGAILGAAFMTSRKLDKEDDAGGGREGEAMDRTRRTFLKSMAASA